MREPPPERYELTWTGKRAALAEARTPPRTRLRLDPDRSIEPQSTAHLLVQGDNLDALKLLEPDYGERVKLIYIDPPYNTGEDFVYDDNFGTHDRWLSMMCPRLQVARRLLQPDGIILVSIDEHEHHNLVLLMCEIFGEENHLGDFIWKKKSGGSSDVATMVLDHEYIVAFARTSKARLLDDPHASVSTRYPHTDDEGRYSLERLDKQNLGYAPSLDFPIEGPDGQVRRVHHKDPDRKQARWRWSAKSVEERYDELVFRGDYVYTKNRQKKGARPRSLLIDGRFGRTRSGRRNLMDLFGAEVLDHPKPLCLLEHLVTIGAGPEDVVLDFFAGSGTTAHAVMAVNAADGGRRRSINVQLDEPCGPGTAAAAQGFATLADVCAERIRRAAASLPETGRNEDRGLRVYRLQSGLREETTVLV